MSDPNAQIGAEDALRNALDAQEGAPGTPPPEPESFSREYVRDLRAENAQYRTRANAAERAWEGVPEADRQTWEQLVQLTARDPAAGAAELKRIAEAMLEPVTPPPPPPDPSQPMTYEQMQPYIEQQVSAQVRQQQQLGLISQIEQEAKQLGYEVGTQDYINLLWVADKYADTDLKKADAMIQEQRAAWVEQRITELAEQGGFPRPVRGGGAPANSQDIKNFEQAKASLNARLNSWE